MDSEKIVVLALVCLILVGYGLANQPGAKLLGPYDTNQNPSNVELEVKATEASSGGDTNWKNIELTETSGGSYDNYVTILKVEHQENMKDNFSDVRIYESDLSTQVNFGLLNKTDGDHAYFAFKRDYQSGQTQELYLEYGDSSANAAWVDQSTWQGWVNNWHESNYWGKAPADYTSTCDLSAHSISGNIPSWANIAFFSGFDPDAGTNAYGGLAEINGNKVAWADGNSANTCSKGQASRRRDRYDLYRVHEQSENSGAWNFGGSNTVNFGHFAGGEAGIYVSWFPKRPNKQIKDATLGSGRMNISFYDDSDQSQISKIENVSNGTYTAQWTGLSEDQTYNWYANVTGSTSTNKTQIGSFTTIGVTLNWNDQSSNEDGFRIYSNASGTLKEVADVPPDSETATLYNQGLEFNKNTTYEVAAYNQYGESNRVTGYIVP